MMVSIRRRPAGVVLILLAAAALLLAFTATGVAAATGNGSTICDTAKCGKGTCSEVPGLIPVISAGYQCTCEPGWSQLKPFNIPVASAPCIIPNCSFDTSCYNVTLPLAFPPKGIPITDPCVAINCGYGDCKKGEGFSYSCVCQQPYINFLNLTALPCVKNCTFGSDCSELGIGPQAPPPMPSAAAPPPGFVSSSHLLQQLLWLAILFLQLVV